MKRPASRVSETKTIRQRVQQTQTLSGGNELAGVAVVSETVQAKPGE